MKSDFEIALKEDLSEEKLDEMRNDVILFQKDNQEIYGIPFKGHEEQAKAILENE
jgi:hypothetical protein